MSDAPKPASLDDRKSVVWRGTDINIPNGYVIRDYTANEDPMVMVIPASELLNVIRDIAENKRKVAVYAVGERILDFT